MRCFALLLVAVACSATTRTVNPESDGGAGEGGAAGSGGSAGSSAGLGATAGAGGSSGAAGSGASSGAAGAGAAAGSSGAAGLDAAGGSAADGASGGGAGVGGADSGADASSLPCDPAFSFSHDPITAGVSFDVTFRATEGYTDIALLITGPGAPTTQFVSGGGAPPDVAWIHTVSGHGAGTHQLTFVKEKVSGSAGVVVGRCTILVAGPP